MDHGHTQDRRTQPRGRFHIAGDLVYGTLRWIARHVHGFFSALGLYLSLGFALGIAAVAVFAFLGRVVAGGATRAFDVMVLRFFATYRTPLLDDIMLEVTTLGDTAVVVTMVGVASIFLWLTRHHYSVYLLVTAVAGGAILSQILKTVYDRPRPTVVPWLADTVSASFPSGHAMTAFVTYGSLAYLVGRIEPTSRLRHVTWALAIAFVLAIGLSRVYIGVHYPSDVIAGYLAGLAWIAIVASALADRKSVV